MKLLLSEIETEALKYALAKFKYGTGTHDGHAQTLDDLYKEVCELLESHHDCQMAELEAIREASDDFFGKYTSKEEA